MTQAVVATRREREGVTRLGSFPEGDGRQNGEATARRWRSDARPRWSGIGRRGDAKRCLRHRRDNEGTKDDACGGVEAMRERDGAYLISSVLTKQWRTDKGNPRMTRPRAKGDGVRGGGHYPFVST